MEENKENKPIDPWQELWKEFMQTKEFKTSHRPNYASNYLKWLQKNFNAPTKK